MQIGLGNIYFFFNKNFIKINLPTHVCLRRNYRLFFLITHWSYFKNNNLLYKLNVYKISANKYQVVHSWDLDEISVFETLFGKYLEYASLILRNYKKTKEDKNCQTYNFFYFKYALNLSDNSRITCSKT